MELISPLNLLKYLKGRGITYTDIKCQIFKMAANEAGVEPDRLPIMIQRKY